MEYTKTMTDTGYLKTLETANLSWSMHNEHVLTKKSTGEDIYQSSINGVKISDAEIEECGKFRNLKEKVESEIKAEKAKKIAEENKKYETPVSPLFCWTCKDFCHGQCSIK